MFKKSFLHFLIFFFDMFTYLYNNLSVKFFMNQSLSISQVFSSFSFATNPPLVKIRVTREQRLENSAVYIWPLARTFSKRGHILKSLQKISRPFKDPLGNTVYYSTEVYIIIYIHFSKNYRICTLLYVFNQFDILFFVKWHKYKIIS